MSLMTKPRLQVKLFSWFTCYFDLNYMYTCHIGNISVFTLSGIASQNATQIDPPLRLKMPRVAPMCDTKKKQKLADKNTQYHGRWQWIKNAVIHSSILVSSIRIILARHIFSFN